MANHFWEGGVWGGWDGEGSPGGGGRGPPPLPESPPPTDLPPKVPLLKTKLKPPTCRNERRRNGEP